MQFMQRHISVMLMCVCRSDTYRMLLDYSLMLTSLLLAFRAEGCSCASLLGVVDLLIVNLQRFFFFSNQLCSLSC